MDKKISIIVPLKNIAPYIHKCLDTLIHQTLKEIEIICINDGSTDSSLEILEEYAKNDSRIIIINNAVSEGQSSARNKGLEIAKGQYIGFVDGDDWVEVDMFEKLYNSAISNDTDITMCASCTYDEFSKICKKDDKYYNLSVFDSSFDNKVFSHFDTKDFILDINVVIWNKIYKREFLQKINAKFIEGYIYEDLPFFFLTYLNADRVTLIRDMLYYYRIKRQGSTMSVATGKIIDRVDMALLAWHLLYNTPYYNEISHKLITWFIDDIFYRYTLAEGKYQKEFFFRMKKIFSLIETTGIDKEVLSQMFSYSDYIAVKRLPYQECNRIFLSNYKLAEKNIYVLREELLKRIERMTRSYAQGKENYFQEYLKHIEQQRNWFEQKMNYELTVQRNIIMQDYEKRLEAQDLWHEKDIKQQLQSQKDWYENEIKQQLQSQKDWYENEIQNRQKQWYENEMKPVKPLLKAIKNYGAFKKSIKIKLGLSKKYVLEGNPKVSVILPVYNVGKYLKQSLDSLITQTLEDIEIICVNDGSTDDGKQILDEYAKKDSRIKVIHKEHAGTGAARNDGLKIATGECIGFVDPDDWVKENMFERLYDVLKEQNVDIVMCMPDGFNDQKQIFQAFGYFVEDNFAQLKNRGVFNWKDISPFSYPMCIWNKLYRKELFDKNNIDFAEGLDFEDHKVIFKSLLTAKSIYFIPEKLYVYRHNRPGSILSDNDNRLIDHIEIFNIVEKILEETGTSESLRKDFITYKVHNLLYYYGMIKDEHKADYYQKMLESIKETNLTEDELNFLYQNYPDLKTITDDIKIQFS